MSPGLWCIVQTQAVVTFGLQSESGATLAQLTSSGSLSLFGLYTEANDIPAQREALLELYNATAGQNWTADVYNNTVFLEQAAATISATSTFPGESDASSAMSAPACYSALVHHTTVACRYLQRDFSPVCRRHAAQGSVVHRRFQLLSLVGSGVLPDSIRGFTPLLLCRTSIHRRTCTCWSAHRLLQLGSSD